MSSKFLFCSHLTLLLSTLFCWFKYSWNGIHLLLSPAASHSGWEDHTQGDQFHYIHHAKFECNYGSASMVSSASFGQWKTFYPIIIPFSFGYLLISNWTICLELLLIRCLTSMETTSTEPPSRGFKWSTALDFECVLTLLRPILCSDTCCWLFWLIRVFTLPQIHDFVKHTSLHRPLCSDEYPRRVCVAIRGWLLLSLRFATQ